MSMVIDDGDVLNSSLEAGHFRSLFSCYVVVRRYG